MIKLSKTKPRFKKGDFYSGKKRTRTKREKKQKEGGEKIKK